MNYANSEFREGGKMRLITAQNPICWSTDVAVSTTAMACIPQISYNLYIKNYTSSCVGKKIWNFWSNLHKLNFKMVRQGEERLNLETKAGKVGPACSCTNNDLNYCVTTFGRWEAIVA